MGGMEGERERAAGGGAGREAVTISTEPSSFPWAPCYINQ